MRANLTLAALKSSSTMTWWVSTQSERPSYRTCVRLALINLRSPNVFKTRWRSADAASMWSQTVSQLTRSELISKRDRKAERKNFLMKYSPNSNHNCAKSPSRCFLSPNNKMSYLRHRYRPLLDLGFPRNYSSLLSAALLRTLAGGLTNLSSLGKKRMSQSGPW